MTIRIFVSSLVCFMLFNCARANTNCEYLSSVKAPSNGTGWVLGKVLSKDEVMAKGIEKYFSIDTISDAVFKRMREGGSYPAGCTVARSELRYIKVLHCNYSNQTVCGEIVCNKLIAQDLYEIFMELYKKNYQIDKMVLIDNYHAIDEESMRDNNSSGFCYRTVAGTKKLSKHARGLAVDINTEHNPYAKYDERGNVVKLQPNTKVAREYAKRNPRKPHMIDRNDLAYKLFIQHGFIWGGNWKSSKDYQHFEK